MTLKLTKGERDLLEALEDMVNQNCQITNEKGETYLDSFALSAHAHAMRLLSDYGRLNIEAQTGRRVIGHWANAEGTSDDPS